MKTWVHGFALGCLTLAACSTDVEDAATARVEAAIVRSTAQNGNAQVVLLYVQTRVNGVPGQRTCSGTLIAPRVVLTAAHCLENVSGTQLFAYWGRNFATDFANLTVIGPNIQVPPPGQPSLFAQADSFETHPDWNRNLYYPDLGVVYLDRLPPFSPLSLARTCLGPNWNGTTATLQGWGASAALSADLSQTTGGQVLRTGRTVLLGSPTAADYHPEDPNLGMLVPAIRRDTLKTDGRAPNSNTCSGDSGSPLLVSALGRDYVAGVSSWTGLWCENYSLFTRLDPFLPFLDRAEKRGGRDRLVPFLDCVAENPDSTLAAYFGYENKNGVSVDIPQGGANALSGDTQSRRVSHFLPGVHHFAFSVDFAPGRSLVYRLTPEFSPATTVRADKFSPRCGPEVGTEVACGGACRAQLNAGCDGVTTSDSQCIEDCLRLVSVYPQCTAEIDAVNRCYAATPPSPDHWFCPEGGFLPGSFDCAEPEAALFTCFGF